MGQGHQGCSAEAAVRCRVYPALMTSSASIGQHTKLLQVYAERGDLIELQQTNSQATADFDKLRVTSPRPQLHSLPHASAACRHSDWRRLESPPSAASRRLVPTVRLNGTPRLQAVHGSAPAPRGRLI